MVSISGSIKLLDKLIADAASAASPATSSTAAVQPTADSTPAATAAATNESDAKSADAAAPKGRGGKNSTKRTGSAAQSSKTTSVVNPDVLPVRKASLVLLCLANSGLITLVLQLHRS